MHVYTYARTHARTHGLLCHHHDTDVHRAAVNIVVYTELAAAVFDNAPRARPPDIIIYSSREHHRRETLHQSEMHR